MTDGKDAAGRYSFSKLANGAIAVWMLLGVLPLGFPMFGFEFLPSDEWTTSISAFSIVAGLASGGVLFWVIVKRYDAIPGNEFKKFLVVIFAAMFGYVIGRNVVVILVPLVLAVVVGHSIELPFTVFSSHGSGTRGCRSPIVVTGLPFLFDRICGVSDETRRTYVPGDHLIVAGRGTSLGVFPKSLQHASN